MFDLSPPQNSLFRRATRYIAPIPDIRRHTPSLANPHAPTVCKTCSDYKHVCLGYSESTAHLRSHSDSASRAPPISSIVNGNDPSQQSSRSSRAVESCSPEPSHAPIRQSKLEKSPQALKRSDSKDASSRDTSARTNKEADSQLAFDSPESSKSRRSWRVVPNSYAEPCCNHHTKLDSLFRSHLNELQ